MTPLVILSNVAFSTTAIFLQKHIGIPFLYSILAVLADLNTSLY
jgi:hypothetical protein